MKLCTLCVIRFELNNDCNCPNCGLLIFIKSENDKVFFDSTGDTPDRYKLWKNN